MNMPLLAATAVALITTSAPIHADQVTTRQQLVGTWKVLTLRATSGGKVSNPLGEHPAGFVTITPSRMWLLFVDSTRRAPATAALTDAEAVVAMKSHVAWTGSYVATDQAPDGLKVTAHVDAASSEALNGTERVYIARISGNKLSMRSTGVIVPMTGATSVVEFELVRAD